MQEYIFDETGERVDCSTLYKWDYGKLFGDIPAVEWGQRNDYEVVKDKVFLAVVLVRLARWRQSKIRRFWDLAPGKQKFKLQQAIQSIKDKLPFLERLFLEDKWYEVVNG